MIKDVLIVGGGIAGLCSAIQFERAGFNVELVEHAPEWKPVGAGIVLWPNSIKILDKLGLKAEIEAVGNDVIDMTVVDAAGKKVSSLTFEKVFEKGIHAVAVLRADLHKVLIGAVKNTNIKHGTTVDSISDAGTKTKVKLSDGSEKEYDMVIGADGIHSKTRKLLFGEIKPRYAGYTNWRFVVHGDIGTERNRAFEMWGSGKRFGIVPVGSGNSIYCFGVMNAPEGKQEYNNITAAKFKELFGEFGWKARNVMDLITDDTKFIHNDLHDVRLNEWYKGNTVLIGDAAHAITPNLGAGAAMAMEDSLIITKNIIKYGNTAEAYKAYYDQRFKRVTKICNDSFRLGKMGNLENGFLRSVRNFASRIMPEKFYISMVRKVTGDINKL